MDLTRTLTGIIGVINTPFDADGNVHTPSLVSYIDHSLEAGVCGSLTLGMAAETPKLTSNEKELIVSAVVEHVSGRVPVIAGVSAASHQERRQCMFITGGVREPILKFDSWHERVFDELITRAIKLNEEIMEKSANQTTEM